MNRDDSSVVLVAGSAIFSLVDIEGDREIASSRCAMPLLQRCVDSIIYYQCCYMLAKYWERRQIG